MSQDLAGQLAAAASEVERACHLLCSPSPKTLDQCAALLEAAIGKVTACRPGLDPHQTAENAGLSEGRRLAAAVQRARRLLESASAYHQNWLRRLGAMSCGYTERGEPGSVARDGRIVIQG